ncbi:hypothetical protein MFRU_012g02150 [Monilinia fructicola]|nr:hypothetical protein MFRU_012g02150 [Monilinia fructicola]
MVLPYERRIQDLKKAVLELSIEQKTWKDVRIFKGDKSTSAGLRCYTDHLKERGAKMENLISKRNKISEGISATIDEVQNDTMALREIMNGLHFEAPA